MMEELLKSPDRLGGVLILAGLVYAFIKGLVVPRYVLDKTEKDCQFFRDGWVRQVQLTDRSLDLAHKVKDS